VGLMNETSQITQANRYAPQSTPRSDTPVDSPSLASSTSLRPTAPTPPGGPKTIMRRRAAADRQDKVANARPASTRAAGAGGSTSTMLSMFTIGLAARHVSDSILVS